MLEYLINNDNKKTTQESTYIKENKSEINEISELTEFPPLINKKEPTNITRNTPSYWLKIKPYVQTGSSYEGNSMDSDLITCEDKICIV